MNYRLVQFIDSYDPPLRGLQEDLNFVSPRIGEVSFIFGLLNSHRIICPNDISNIVVGLLVVDEF